MPRLVLPSSGASTHCGFSFAFMLLSCCCCDVLTIADAASVGNLYLIYFKGSSVPAFSIVITSANECSDGFMLDVRFDLDSNVSHDTYFKMKSLHHNKSLRKRSSSK